MWRTIFRPASVIAVVAVLVLAGCADDEQTTSAGAVATTTRASGASTTATTLVATTLASATTTAVRCANVTFSADSEDIASDIRSTGLSCADAEAFVRKIGPQVSSMSGPTRVETDGFVCNRLSVRSGDHGPPLATFDCANGAAKVIFVRALVS